MEVDEIVFRPVHHMRWHKRGQCREDVLDPAFVLFFPIPDHLLDLASLRVLLGTA